MKQKVFTYARNNGDGSCSIDVYSSEEELKDNLEAFGLTIEEVVNGDSYEVGYIDNTYIEFDSNVDVKFKSFTIYSEA